MGAVLYLCPELNLIQGGFFNWSPLKMTKCQTHWKIWHLELFWWDLQCNLTLSHFLGRNSQKNHPVYCCLVKLAQIFVLLCSYQVHLAKAVPEKPGVYLKIWKQLRFKYALQCSVLIYAGARPFRNSSFFSMDGSHSSGRQQSLCPESEPSSGGGVQKTFLCKSLKLSLSFLQQTK